MQADARLGKTERQRLIASLVSRKRIGTQHELMQALAGAGCRVTQATVSRDIAQLGLEKELDAVGRLRYALPAGTPRRGNPREAVRRVLQEFGRDAAAAQNLVVVTSELGSAPAIARALDRLGHPRIVGTLAGDDTVLVIARNAADARALAAQLNADLA